VCLSVLAWPSFIGGVCFSAPNLKQAKGGKIGILGKFGNPPRLLGIRVEARSAPLRPGEPHRGGATGTSGPVGASIPMADAVSGGGQSDRARGYASPSRSRQLVGLDTCPAANQRTAAFCPLPPPPAQTLRARAAFQPVRPPSCSAFVGATLLPRRAAVRLASSPSPSLSSSRTRAGVLSAVATGGQVPWEVHKFGGSSLGSAERIGRVADLLVAGGGAGVGPDGAALVVVSAVGGVTDMLVRLVDAAVSRADGTHYLEDLAAIHELHVAIVENLLPESGRGVVLGGLAADVRDLKDLLRACWIARSASTRVRDLIVGHGEVWSAQILWAALRDRSGGRAVAWMDARDVLVARSTEGRGARKIVCFDESRSKLGVWLKSNPVGLVVATGFVCQDMDGVASTLGRNGSDYSAAAFANLLDASSLQIWTDVDGVYSADPRVVNDAIVIPTLTYKEAAELAYFGASVLHPDTMAPVIDGCIPTRIRNSFNLRAPGTLVCASSTVERDGDGDVLAAKKSLGMLTVKPDARGVKGFTTVSNVSLVNIEGTGMIGVPGIASRAFQALFTSNVSVILIAQASSEYSICAAVPSAQGGGAMAALQTAFRAELDDGLISSVSQLADCSILAMVGERMQQRPGVSSRLFASLSRAGVNIRAMAQGSSEHNISVVVDSASESRALRAAHSSFYLSDQTVSVGIIGPGVVGSALISQIADQLESLRSDFGVDLRVRGIATTTNMLVGEPIDLADWRESLASGAGVRPMSLDAFAAHIQSSALPHAVICDCTASGPVSEYYATWLRQGIHIITPNKKANSGPLEYYKRMREAQRRLNTHFFYEANVGAGLPIISSIRDLLRTGDQFLEIEGVFSGTLSFIFNEFDGSEPFSAVVARARELGYTEPEPRDDLGGVDVARKVVILAREIGIDVELSDVPVESLVPAELQGDDVSTEQFMARLPGADGALTAMANEAAEAGELLRYVGIVAARTGKCSVELRRYKKSHPFGRLQGSDNIVSFRTRRYDAQPLVVQGPGAGAAVTAAGVFADMLRLAAYLGAPSTAELG
jgi:bifunctional aspartokinase / homoserine dehydrogenase 1